VIFRFAYGWSRARWLDVVWSLLALVGLEKLRLTLGFTPANALDLYKWPSRPAWLAPAIFAGGVFARLFLLIAAAGFLIGACPLSAHAKGSFGLWRTQSKSVM